MASADPGFGVYIHWPFCAAKCPYCDFNSHVRLGGIDENAFLSSYLAELDFMADLAPVRQVRSIFIGGGTPSLMSVTSVSTIIDHIASLWSIDPQVEITMEANPSSVDASRFSGYRKAGVNRISVGVQALNDQDLKFLGRLHNVDEAINALEIAHTCFDRVSFDMIYARPDQSLEDWAEELSWALQLSSEHLSLYQLTIEPGTPFAKLHQSGKLIIPDQDLSAEHYNLTDQICRSAGLVPYEVSNYAMPGSECQHNLLYWRYGEYAGVGPGAHGRLVMDNQRLATSTLLNPEQWSGQVKKLGHGLNEQNPLSMEDQALEMLLMSMRTGEGLDLSRFRETTGFDIDRAIITGLVKDGLLHHTSDPETIIASPRGRLLLNSLTEKLAGSIVKIENVLPISQATVI